jgi:hypothetical protein
MIKYRPYEARLETPLQFVESVGPQGFDLQSATT